MFSKRVSVEQIEEGTDFCPKFNQDGLVPVVVTCHETKVVLMHGYMSKEALQKTIVTQEVHYWSRSRKKLWKKGATSGYIQRVKEIRIDDDQDTLWISVIDGGSSCHVGYRSCFYRSLLFTEDSNKEKVKLVFQENKKVFDPKNVYKLHDNSTIV